MCCKPRVTLLLPALLLPLPLLGCGDTAGTPLVPVSGRVMMDYKPLAHATIRFTPQSKPGGAMGPLAIGTTDAEGRYTLKTVIKGRDFGGAVPGKHHVQISVVDRTVGARARTSNQVPRRYNRDSKLSFSVPAEGTQEANFLDLKRN
jgi:hypothetical protein